MGPREVSPELEPPLPLSLPPPQAATPKNVPAATAAAMTLRRMCGSLRSCRVLLWSGACDGDHTSQQGVSTALPRRVSTVARAPRRPDGHSAHIARQGLS